MIPIRFPSPEIFTRVREAFRAIGYTSESVDEQMHREPRLMSAYVHGRLVTGFDAAQTLTRLFFGGSVHTEELRTLLGPQTLEDLHSLGLLEPAADNTLRPTVRLRPMLGLYVIADLHQRYEERNADFVYPPDGPNTHEYITYLPTRYEGHFLEACGGTGVAALIAASRGATHASSFDISPRCSQFAAFSARLSGLGNFTAATGDAFAPAAGRTYDTIAMHPPYVPVLGDRFVFSDGGQDGEAITRKHIEAIPHHLNPGGRLYCRCMATDRRGEPFEARLRNWLGPRHTEFDIVLHTTRHIDPIGYLREHRATGQTRQSIAAWIDMVQSLAIEQYVLCAFILQRHTVPREPFTLRRRSGDRTRPYHLAWLMNWQTLCATGEAANIILNSPLHPTASSLTTSHKPEEGEWIRHVQSVTVEAPYPITREVDDLAAYLIPKLDGRTGLQLLHDLQIDANPTAFAAYLAELAALGFLRVS